MKKLLLFVHGLTGSADGTWKNFPDLIRVDPQLSEQYDVAHFEYSTSGVGSHLSLASYAAALKTEIENRYARYADIALIAHSQGGLISRYFIAERLLSSQPLRVSRLLTFATPHHGSGLATFGKQFAPITSQEIADLDPNSDFLQALGVAWGQSNADRRVFTKYVVASNDAIVGKVSAMGAWSPGCEVVDGVGHMSVVKPESAEAPSFIIAKKFLLDDRIDVSFGQPDYRVPLLRRNYINDPQSARFIYSARVLPLVGRDDDFRTLSGFLDNPEHAFRWMIMRGSGGVGKSRLALEVCLAVRGDWHAGFLGRERERDPDWARWQPLQPTLIVIDYAARNTERVGELLRALAGRDPLDGTARIALPVRVLLIERLEDKDWIDKVVGAGASAAQINAHASTSLELTTISDLWPIFVSVLAKSDVPTPNKVETLDALKQLDPEQRPLFAYFMADAIAAGRDVRKFDAVRLVEDVIKRSREGYWKPAGSTPKEERLLALATMMGGLLVKDLNSITDQLLPSWDVDRHPQSFLAMTGQPSGDFISPLEPDIVGELFALECLSQNNISQDDRVRLCALAWRMGAEELSSFLHRANHDFANHAMLPWLWQPPASDEKVQAIWATSMSKLLNDDKDLDLAQAHTILSDVRATATRNNTEMLWDAWALAASPIVRRLVPVDAFKALTLLREMRVAAEQHGKVSMWWMWSHASFEATSDFLKIDSVSACGLLNEIYDTLSEKHLWENLDRFATVVRAIDSDVTVKHESASTLESWTRLSVSLLGEIGACTLVDVRGLMGKLRLLAETRDDVEIRTAWATATVFSKSEMSLSVKRSGRLFWC